MATKKKKAGGKKKTVAKAKATKKPAAKKPTPKKRPIAAKKPVAKKPVAKAKAKPKPAAKKAPISRRDGAGHIDPRYAKELLAKSNRRNGRDRDEAFLRGRSKGDPLAEEMGKEFLEVATSGEDEGNEIRDRIEPEELGGPFVETKAKDEYDYEPDESNPEDALREPLPTT